MYSNLLRLLNGADYPSKIYYPISMLHPKEHELLYVLGKNYFSGQGCIVDVGAFGGASAYCFACGLEDNYRVQQQRKYIHSYDLFISNELINKYLKNVLCGFFDESGRLMHTPAEFKKGYYFEDFFRYQTAAFKELIELHIGDLLETTAPEEPIEILFLDACKTEDLTKAIFKNFLPRLKQGAYIVQQDFYTLMQQPFLALYHDFIDDFFTCEINRIGATRIFRNKRSITLDEVINTFPDDIYNERNIEGLNKYKSTNDYDYYFFSICQALAHKASGNTEISKQISEKLYENMPEELLKFKLFIKNNL
jgi:hypothetical protein